MRRMLKKGLGLSSLGILALLTTQVYAAGYKVEFQSASTFADAGDAAVVDDASTNWYNSAGLVLLPQQLVSSGTLAYAPTLFSGTAVAPNVLASPRVPIPPFIGSGRASSHTTVVLPSFHYAYPIDASWSLGFSAVPAWGLIENYGQHSLLRYTGYSIYSKSMDLEPSIAWRFNDNWSFGIGPDFHYFSSSTNFAINTMVGPLGFTDSLEHYNGHDWAFGAHAGILFQWGPCIRVGLNYRSKLVERLEGDSGFDGQIGHLPPGANFTTHDFVFRVPLPPVTTLSGYWAVTPALALVGSVEYEQWDIVQNINATGIAALSPVTLGGVEVNTLLPQLYSNTWDFALGAKYAWSDEIMLRGSVKYLGTPTDNRVRTPLFPDAEKLGLQLGAHYQYNRYLGFDGAYGHAWFRTVPIHAENPLTGAVSDGRVRTSADIFAAGIVWTLC